jgi:hypothetical protein
MRMKKLSCLLVMAALASPAWADCTYPKKPGRIPDGNTATRDEMLAAQRVVKQYQADITAYLECLKAEHQAALDKDPSLSQKQKDQMTARYTQKNDAAVDEAQEVANRFNEQLRVYRAKNDK